MYFCYIHTISYRHILDQLSCTIDMVKRIQIEEEEEEVKGTYIWLSCTFAVVTSAVRGYCNLPCGTC